MSYTHVGGLRIYTECHGKTQPGRDLVLIHGAGQDTLSWRFVVPSFVRSHRVWLMDLPGHGKSQIPEDGPIDDLARYARFLAGWLETERVPPATLVGHSMSAGVALMVALMAPERVRGIVAVDGGGETNRTHGGDLLKLVDVNPADYFEENFRRICSPATAVARVEEIAWDLTRCSPSVVYADIRAYSRLSVDSQVSVLTCPVSFLHGADDWSIPPDIALATASRLMCPNRVRILPATGHFPHVENPAAFNPALRSELAWQRRVASSS